MKSLFQLVRREFKLFFSNSTLISVFLLGPIIYAIMLSSVYKSGKVVELPIVVIDRDNSPMSQQVIEMLDDNEGLKVVRVLPESNDAKKEMIDQRAAGLIVIPDRFEGEMLTGRYPEIMIYCNTVNMLTANYVSKSIQTSLGTFAAGAEMKALQRKGMSGAQAYLRYEPFKQNYIKVFNETGNYFTFMWPAMLTVVLQQVILLAMAVTIAAEVQKGTLAIGVGGQKRGAVTTVLSKVLPIWILSVPMVALFYGFHVYFNAPLPTSPLNFALLTALFIMAATFLGTLFSAIIPDALKATQILMLISAPGFIIGGYTWPTEAMAGWVQVLADSLPLTPFVNGFKLMLFEEASLSQVSDSVIHLMIQVVLYFLLSVSVVNWRMKREAAKSARDSASI